MQRSRYQGVVQILQFNRRFYIAASAAAAAVLLVTAFVPPRTQVLLLAAAMPPLFWICSSLAVSHYVYDLYPLYDLSWLARLLPQVPQRWANIHAGLDETSHLLKALYPATHGDILDIYDPQEMTEHSIEEARLAKTPEIPPRSADWRALPLASGALDAAFLFFAAHELRRHAARVQLFLELARVLRIGGELVLVEHARDCANFLGFGPGFFHFLPIRAWSRAASTAGLEVRHTSRMTPFVHVFIFRRCA